MLFRSNLASIIDPFMPTVFFNSYDDKVNWRQTSKIWQLLDVNYSRNNALDPATYSITGYNSFGLPLQFVQTPIPPNYDNHPGMLFTPAYYYDILNFQYACDVPGGPGW